MVKYGKVNVSNDERFYEIIRWISMFSRRKGNQ